MVPATAHAAHAPAPAAAPAKSPAPEVATADEDKLCRSPIAGIVIRANVVPGQKIAENDLIIVIEAMKMENMIAAPVAGIVQKVNVKLNQMVETSTALVELGTSEE